MDIVTLNKLSTPSKTSKALNIMYEKKQLSVDDALTLIVFACKKKYGLLNTVKIIHALGVDKF